MIAVTSLLQFIMNLIEISQNAIKTQFPKLILSDAIYLKQLLADILTKIGLLLNIGIDSFVEQLALNNYKNACDIINVMLPFINDEYKSELVSLDDIATVTLGSKSYDVDLQEPKYKYSNIQYNRCDTINKTEAVIDIKHEIAVNCNLLVETMIMMANRLFPNWSDILPLTLNDFKNSELYKNTIDVSNSKMITNISFDNFNVSTYVYSLYCGHMYDILALCQHVLNDVVVNKLIQTIDIVGDAGGSNFKIPIAVVLNEYFNSELHIDALFNAFVNHKGYQMLTAAQLSDMFNLIKLLHDDVNIVQLLFENNKFVFDTTNPKHLMDFVKKLVFLFVSKIMHIWLRKFIVNNELQLFSINDFLTNLHLLKSNSQTDGQMQLDNVNVDVNVDANIDITNIISDFNNFCNTVAFAQLDLNVDANQHWYLWRELNARQCQQFVNNLNKSSQSKKVMYINCIFETMIVNGMLSHVQFASGLKNDELTSVAYRKYLRRIINSTKYDSGYHFATGLPFSNVIVNIEKGDSTNKSQMSKKYIDYVIDERYDITKIATLQWANQLQFFHKFINNRVIFVTGGTGVGKTSQIPKLALYAIKTINYKMHGKLQCTAPTKLMVSNNALNMSNEIGTPIQNTIEKEDSDFTTNYSIQFKYKISNDDGNKKKSNKKKDGVHVAPQFIDANILSLQFCTDGIVEMQLSRNPLLVKNAESGNFEDIYDVLVIDESHMHNFNMDIILTMMRTTCYYNNSMKLLVMSATMDDDEHIYRRFYRMIDDNRMKPLDMKINEKGKAEILNRNVVDRRFHVGSKLRFPIKEIYLDKCCVAENIECCFANVVTIINKIASNLSETGEILVFSTIPKEINKLVKLINAKTSSDVIALPLYSKLMKPNDKIVPKIYEIKSKLDVSKNDDLTKISIKTKLNSANINRYRICVIVATNVVEASITIPTLKYVIDLGKRKNIIYDYKIDTDVVHNEYDVTEQSRLQRKGRVGRTQAGVVYYMYPKYSKLNTPKTYEITATNCIYNLFKLLNNCNFKTNTVIFDENNDINMKKSKPIDDKHKYYEFIKMRYQMSNGKMFDFFDNDIANFVKFNGIERKINELGTYSSKSIIDSKGIFYLVHPDELVIKRNLFGNIMNPHDVSKTAYYLAKLRKFQFVDLENGDNFCKSQFGQLISELIKIVSIDIETDIVENQFAYIIAYAYSILYGCSDLMIKIIALLMQITKIGFQNNFVHTGKSNCDSIDILLKIIEANDFVTNNFVIDDSNNNNDDNDNNDDNNDNNNDNNDNNNNNNDNKIKIAKYYMIAFDMYLKNLIMNKLEFGNRFFQEKDKIVFYNLCVKYRETLDKLRKGFANKTNKKVLNKLCELLLSSKIAGTNIGDSNCCKEYLCKMCLLHGFKLNLLVCTKKGKFVTMSSLQQYTVELDSNFASNFIISLTKNEDKITLFSGIKTRDAMQYKKQIATNQKLLETLSVHDRNILMIENIN